MVDMEASFTIKPPFLKYPEASMLLPWREVPDREGGAAASVAASFFAVKPSCDAQSEPFPRERLQSQEYPISWNNSVPRE